MKSILFVLPYKPKIGGVEACLFEAGEKLNHNIKIFIISKLSFYDLKTQKKLDFIHSLLEIYNFVGYFYWQAGAVIPFLIFLRTKKRFLFINSSIRYRNFKNLCFKLSLIITDVVLFDSINSFESHKYIKKFPFFKKHKIIPFITDFKVPKNKTKYRDIPYILILRWSEEKGIKCLKEFSEKINKKLVVFTYPKPNFTDLPKNILIKDGRNRKDLIDKLLCSKVHISLSPKEGFSLVAYEAIKCGCVPISIANTEISQYIENYFAKKIKNIDDLVDLAKEISGLSLKEHTALIHYLSSRIKKLPYFFQSIETLID